MEEEKKNHDGLVRVLIAIIVVLILVIAAGIYFIFLGKDKKTEQNGLAVNVSTTDISKGNAESSGTLAIKKHNEEETINLLKRLKKIDGSYIKLESIIANNDAKYDVNAIVNETVLIDNVQYDNMVNNKKIVLNDVEYEYGIDPDREYGYIKKDNIRYDIFKEDGKYMFLLHGSAGAGQYYTEQDKVVLELSENTEVYNAFTGKTDSLKGSKNLIENEVKKEAGIFVEENNNNIRIYISNK